MTQTAQRSFELSERKRLLLQQMLRKKGLSAPRSKRIEKRDPGLQTLPLSFAQQRLWFLHRLEPESAAYNLAEAVLLEGDLDIAVLAASLSEIVRRHEVLRTTFATDGGKPQQIVHQPAPQALPMVDLSRLEASERQAVARSWATWQLHQPFDLGSGPLIRTTLLRLAPGEHALLLSLHHIVADGWSIAIFVREAGMLYGALAAQRRAPLPELPLQYADYAVWQQGWLTGDVLEKQLDYWRGQVTGAPWVLDLPTDRPRPPLQSFRGARHMISWPAPLGEHLKALSQRHDATLFHTVLAGLATLLFRWTGQTRLLIGNPNANRNRPEVEGLIGCLVNTLVLRADLSGGPDFATVLGRIREMALAGDSHQELPFEKLIDTLDLERDLSRNPLFQVMFSFQNLEMTAVEEESLRLSQLPFENRTAQFDLNLYLFEAAGGFGGSLEYAVDLFDESTMQRWLGQFQNLLAAAAVFPETRVTNFSLLGRSEHHQLLSEWNDSQTDYAVPAFMPQMIEAQVERAPDAVAIVDGHRQFTYRDLNQRANRLARRLRRLGCGPDARVGLFVERSLEMMVALWGTLKSGAAYLPLDPDYPADRVSFMLRDANVRVLLTQEALLEQLPETAAPVLCLDRDWQELADESGDNPPPIVVGNHPAYVIYTSGSTGRPKGVVVPHAGLRNRLLWMQEAFQLDGSDRVLQKTPSSFDVSVWELFWPFMTGAGLVLARPGGHRDSAYLVERIAEQRVTVLHFVPSMLQIFLEERELERCATLRVVVCSGEALPLALQKRFYERLDAELHNLYGPTEASIDVTHWPCAANDERWAVPIGTTIANTQIHLLDPRARTVPAGVAGELAIGGVNLARGYLARPRLTARSFIPNPLSESPGERLYRTGDLTRHLADGAIIYLGRLDHQVKVRGFRIELGEIEAALARHSEIREVVVVARKIGGSSRLVAYLVAHGEAPSTETLRDFLVETLPEHMVPAIFMPLDELPLSANGKVDRRALPEPGADRPELEGVFIAPRTMIEQALATSWSQVLGVDKVGVRDNFFALGGDSILSIQVLAQLRELGFELSLQDLFQNQTIEKLAPKVRSAGDGEELEQAEPFGLLSDEDRGLVPDAMIDAYPLAVLQRGMIFHSELEPESAIYHDVFSYHLRAHFDLALFVDALQRLAERHPALRTSFDLSTFSEPMQLVHPKVEQPLAVSDLRHLSSQQQEDEITRWVEAEKFQRFTWTRPPLVRFQLHLRGADSFQLSMGLHHSILDGWSVASMFADLFQIYFWLLGKSDEPLPPPRVTAHEFIALERRAMADETSRAYWQNHLAGHTVTTLPRWPHPVAPGAMRSVRAHPVLVPAEVSDGLRQLSESAEVPLKSVLLAAHLKALSLLTGQTSLVTGLVSNGRPETADGERVLGLFLNTLPFHFRLTAGPWRDLARAVFAGETELLSHRRFPLAEVQKGRGGPLFEAAFNFIHFHVYQGINEFEDLEVLGGRFVEETDFPFLANFSRDTGSGHIQLQLRYDVLELSHEQVEAIGQSYVRVLTAMAGAPEGSHESAELLGAAVRHQMLHGWNDTATSYPLHGTLHGWIEERVDAAPDASAVTFEDQTLTFRGLNRRANQLAHHLRQLGVGSETLVGIAAERSLEMVVGLLGILKAGAAYVPIDPTYPADRLRFLIADANVPVLLTQTALLESLPELEARVLALDDPALLAGQPHDNPAAISGPSNLAYTIYTSGSTGRPKGAMNTHEAICNRLFWKQEALGLEPRDRVLQKTPFSFDVSVWEFFWPLMIGARMVLARPEGHKDPTYLIDLIRREQITTLHFVPSMLRSFLADPEAETCTSLERVVASGEALPVDLEEQFHERLEARLFNLYGPTEAAIDVTWWLSSPDPAATTVPIGYPINNLRIHLLDQQAQPVPLATPGELFIGGIGLARGYLRRASLTAERFLPDPVSGEMGGRLYRSGDLARHRPDGAVEFLGRTDFQVKIRGFRIELEEIETALLQHPRIRETVVVAREDIPGHQRLVAYLVASEAPEVAELRELLGETLPEYMIPTFFVPLETMPLNPNGKVDRRALPAPDLAAGQRSHEFIEPRTPAEIALAEIWKQVLGVDRVGTADNYFELGGDSILSIQISARAREAGFFFSPRMLFDHPTLGELAATATESEQTTIDAEQGAVVGQVALLPVQHWFFDQAVVDPHYFNLSLLLEVPDELDTVLLAQATEHLLSHHDALRLRFERVAEGWQQRFAAPSSMEAFSAISLANVAPEERSRIIESTATKLQASLDLENGPLFRLVYFQSAEGDAGRLFILAHHLVIDGVSWRLLLEDLQSAYESLRQGRAVALPAKTSSFKAWSERLVELANSDELATSELDHWRDSLRPGSARLVLDFPDRSPAANTHSSTRTVSVSLTPEETDALVQVVPQAYRTQINDVLLAALTDAFGQVTGVRELTVDLEGHGREEIFEDVDLSRTLGWFTTVFPARFDLTGIEEPGEILKRVKEDVRRLPQRGLGYGLLRHLSPARNELAELESEARPEVLFNYLGQLDQAIPAQSSWHLANESSGRSRSPRGLRAYALEVNGVIRDSRLQVDWTYSSELHEASSVERLGDALLASLRALIEHCSDPAAGGYTPSDFPDTEIDQEHLELVVSDLATAVAKKRSTHRNLESIYPLSPQQEGMLFESLATPGSGVHIEPFTCVLEGALDVEAFERAWQAVIDRHSILRTAFSWRHAEEPLQVVFSRAASPFELVDWRDLSSDEQDQRLGMVMEGERQQGFDPTHAPLMRIRLFQLAEQRYRLLWVHHHILMDGWCRPIVFQEVIACYQAFCAREEPRLSPSRSYRDYIAWMRAARQSLEEAEDYWSQNLAGFRRPNLLGTDAGSLSEGRHERREARLSAEATTRLEAVARSHHLTLSSLVQGAWAILLSRYSNREDVVFGTTVSGRPAELDGVESMVGLFIQTLPFRLDVRPDDTLWSWFDDLQKRHLELRRHEYCSAGEVHQWSDLPGSVPLYHSILVYENFPSIDNDGEEGMTLDLGIGGARSDGAVTRHPLTLLVFEQEQLAMQMVFDGRYLDGPDVENMAGHLVSLLEELSADQMESIGDLLATIPGDEIPSFRNLPAIDLDGPREHVAPRTEAERALVDIFSEVLGMEQVSLRDSFLELGGHSLLSTQIAGRFMARFQIDLPLRLLYESADVEGLMTAIIGDRAGRLDADQLVGLLHRLEEMSDDEVRAALAEVPAPYIAAEDRRSDSNE